MSRKAVRPAAFTPEELAELAAFDAEIDATPPTQQEREECSARDYVFRGLNEGRSFETKRAYYEANREKIAETQRAYREANREKIAEIGAALRRWRLAHFLNQTQLGELIDIGQRTVSYWERGEVPIDFERIERLCPPMMEAFG